MCIRDRVCSDIRVSHAAAGALLAAPLDVALHVATFAKILVTFRVSQAAAGVPALGIAPCSSTCRDFCRVRVRFMSCRVATFACNFETQIPNVAQMSRKNRALRARFSQLFEQTSPRAEQFR